MPEQHAPLMLRVQDALQRSIRSLRALMTDLYPPDLAGGNLEETFAALPPTSAGGTDVTIEVAPMPPLAEETVAALYRVARETLANVAKHAMRPWSGSAWSRSSPAPRHTPQVRLEVSDDGTGVDPTDLDRRSEGHLGLRLLADRLDTLGGRLTVISRPGEGTTVRADLPARPVDDAGPSTPEPLSR